MPKKAINLKTLKFKTILFNKYKNKTMLAIINFPKINEKCIKGFYFSKDFWNHLQTVIHGHNLVNMSPKKKKRKKKEIIYFYLFIYFFLRTKKNNLCVFTIIVNIYVIYAFKAGLSCLRKFLPN